VSGLALVGGTVVDGTGGPPRRAHVRVEHGVVVEVSTERPPSDVPVVDVSGLIVAPGFIDAHSHADFTLPRRPDAEALLRQGCTTVVTGNCGFSPWPFGEPEAAAATDHGAFLDPLATTRWVDLPGFAAGLERARVGVNVVPLAGHIAMRTAVLGSDSRPATDDERGRIVGLATTALAAGAPGVSFGLAYPSGRDADAAELQQVAGAVAAHDAVLAVHLRDEGDRLEEAVEEMLEIARQAGCRLQLSHHKAAGLANRGRVRATLDRIEAARAGGLDVVADAYPFTAGATTVGALLPDWATAAGTDGLQAILADAPARTRLRDALSTGGSRFRLDDVWLVPSTERSAELGGAPLLERAAALRLDPVDAVLRVLDDEADHASMLIFCMDPADVDHVVARTDVLIGSDGWVLDASLAGHPRNFQTFPEALDARRLDRWGLPLPLAVARSTSLVARRFGYADRGLVARGMAADLVAFDAGAMAAGGGYTDPSVAPTGVHLTIVNGEVAWRDGQIERRAGRVLRRRPRPPDSPHLTGLPSVLVRASARQWSSSRTRTDGSGDRQ
jgi:N-acyl-D-amino-acid deacylase